MKTFQLPSEARLWPPFPIWAFLVLCPMYFIGRWTVTAVLRGLQSVNFKALPLASRIDQTKREALVCQQGLSDDDLFQLEKRAFFSKTWLFVCHRSRFDKPGDYHTSDIAGIAFFVVLGKDLRLRAFHNICRHRAYTVVRKACGTSTRFSCKYHGWQYDDQGKLVKAPKFDESPGFVPAQNGLFEVKLIQTREGLVFVNFDASTMDLPFADVKSNLELGACSWLDCFNLTTKTNWKKIANEFSSQARWRSQTSFGWFTSKSKHKLVRLLGPVSMVKQLGEDFWGTMTLLPVSASETVTRCDLYTKEGHEVPPQSIEKWKWILRKEVENMSRSEGDLTTSLVAFAYECGGRTIDLTAILVQHQRIERMEKKKLQPTVRITGTAVIDLEAEALCDAIDGVTNVPELSACLKGSNFAKKIEW